MSPTYRTDPNSDAVALNANGIVTGWVELRLGHARHTFVWQDGQYLDLGVLTDSLVVGFSQPNAINARGDIVGLDGSHAMLWRRVDQLVAQAIPEQ